MVQRECRRRKYRQRKIVPEFTRERQERVKMLDNSCIRDLDSKRMSVSGKPSAARPREGMQSASSEEQSVRKTIEHRNRGNMAAEFKKKKTISENKRGRTRPLYIDNNCARERNWRRRYRAPNLEEADLVIE